LDGSLGGCNAESIGILIVIIIPIIIPIIIIPIIIQS